MRLNSGYRVPSWVANSVPASFFSMSATYTLSASITFRMQELQQSFADRAEFLVYRHAAPFLIPVPFYHKVALRAGEENADAIDVGER